MDNLTSGEDLSEMLEKLMADEKFGEILNAVKSSFSAGAEDSSDSVEVEASAVSADVLPAESPISAIPGLSPELISKLPMIMSMLSGGKPDGQKSDSKLQDRKRLLQALKPFLSQSRRDAVDNIVNIAGIADLLGL